MSHYALTEIRMDQDKVHITECMIALITNGGQQGGPMLAPAAILTYADVANLIVSGDLVYVYQANQPGGYFSGEKVTVIGPDERLATENGTIFDLPEF